MKKMLETLIGWTVSAIGVKAGCWIWDNVLEEKARTFNENRKAKKVSKDEEELE